MLEELANVRNMSTHDICDIRRFHILLERHISNETFLVWRHARRFRSRMEFFHTCQERFIFELREEVPRGPVRIFVFLNFGTLRGLEQFHGFHHCVNAELNGGGVSSAKVKNSTSKSHLNLGQAVRFVGKAMAKCSLRRSSVSDNVPCECSFCQLIPKRLRRNSNLTAVFFAMQTKVIARRRR